MSKSGRYTKYSIDLKKRVMKPLQVIEPIAEFPQRGGDWGDKDLSNRPQGGAIHEKDSIITSENGFKNIKIK